MSPSPPAPSPTSPAALRRKVSGRRPHAALCPRWPTARPNERSQSSLDDAVDYRLSERFAEGRPNVELLLVDSDHQLLDVLDLMWDRVEAFLRGFGTVFCMGQKRSSRSSSMI
jgi:hypothetical protein